MLKLTRNSSTGKLIRCVDTGLLLRGGCCGNIPAVDCIYCGSNQTPYRLGVTISGVTACDQCESAGNSSSKPLEAISNVINGYHILTQRPTNSCYWRVDYVGNWPSCDTWATGDPYVTSLCGDGGAEGFPDEYSGVRYVTNIFIAVYRSGSNWVLSASANGLVNCSGVGSFGAFFTAPDSGCLNISNLTPVGVCRDGSPRTGSASIIEL